MARQQISQTIQKKLLLLSGNECCFPNCSEKLYNRKNTTLLAEFCHINAISPNGPRFDPALSQEQINSLDNLFVLCPNHHKEIDSNIDKYSAEVLMKMKKDHEAKFDKELSTYKDQGEEISTRNNDVEELQEVIEITEVKNLPPKKKYLAVPNYLKREINPIRIDNISIQNKSLIEVVKTEKRITLLGVAGSGKSIELDNLAYHYSLASEEFYPIKIRLNLLSNQRIEDFIYLEFPEFHSIPQERLLFILDALDEVHADHIDLAASKIAILGKSFPKATIIVSCRNNFYITENEKRTSKIEGFCTYILEPLSHDEVLKYIGSTVINSEDFFSKIENLKLFELLYSPFYLVNLVDYFKSKNDIPKSKKEIFEYLIQERFEKDVEKFENSGVEMRSYQIEIEQNIESLALYSTSLGRNYLEEKSEFQKIVQDKKILEIIKRTFIFSKNNSDKWQFEHNNFQEYLAAKCLSRLSFNQIQTFISFPSEHKKIKPNWLNTLSFLFSILDSTSDTFQKLLVWLKSIEPDALVRFEKDKIDIKIRETIFISIYDSYIDKKIRIGNEKFNVTDLAKFVSDSDIIVEYLIEKLRNSQEDLIITDAVLNLKCFDNIQNYRNEIANVLLNNIIGELKNETKYYCLSVLGQLNIHSVEITKQFIEKLDFNNSSYIRAGFYNYIYVSTELEDHVNLFINGIELLSKSERSVSGFSNSDTVYLFDEKNTLNEIFQTIKRKSNIILLLEKFSNYDGYIIFNFDIIKYVLKKAEGLYKEGSSELFDSVVVLHIAFSKRYLKDIKVEIKEFFESTNTTFKAYQILYKHWSESEYTSFEYGTAIASIMNDEIFDDLVVKVKAGRFTENQIFFLRNIIGYEGEKKYHDLFYSKLIELFNSKFMYTENNFEQRKSDRLIKDMELLFDKEQFLKYVKNIFNVEGKVVLTFDELYEYKKAHFNSDNLDNNIALDTLRNWSRDPQKIELQTVIEIVNDPLKWEWFRLRTLVKYDTQIASWDFNENAKAFIQGWVFENLDKANFYTAIEEKDNGGRHYRYMELFIPYFAMRLNLNFIDKVYLDFLFVDCDLIPHKKVKEEEDKKKPLYEFVVKKLGVNVVKSQILKNLKEPSLTMHVKREHYKFCKEYKVTECSDDLFKDIQERKFSDYESKDMIDLFFDLSGSKEKMETLLGHFESEVNHHLIQKLIEQGSDLVYGYCLERLNVETNKEAKLVYISFLLKINFSDSLQYLKKWLLENKEFPFKSINSGQILEANYPDLMEIYEDSIIYKYKYSEHNSGIFLSEIIRLGSSSKKLYTLTKEKFENWIANFSECNYLHYQIQKLEQLYYSSIPQAMTIEQVQVLLKNEWVKKNKLIAFWNTNRTVIEIVLAVLAIIGLLISIPPLFSK